MHSDLSQILVIYNLHAIEIHARKWNGDLVCLQVKGEKHVFPICPLFFSQVFQNPTGNHVYALSLCQDLALMCCYVLER